MRFRYGSGNRLISVSIFGRFGKSLAAALLGLPLCAGAGDMYKWQDEDGIWHFSDKPPEAGTDFDYVDLPAQPQDMGALRKGGSKTEPVYTYFNRYHGPSELELRFRIADNVASDPPLPARIVLAPNAEQQVLALAAADPHRGYSYQLAYTQVPGPPLDSLPSDMDFYPPFPSGREFPISQGFDGDATHKDSANQYAVDIVMPVGTPVLAARGGVVMNLENHFRGGEQKQRYMNRANRIRILHDDGSMAVYAHLEQRSARVRPGMRVEAGAWIANSGNTGFSNGPHLHFVVQINAGMVLESLPFRFRRPGGGTMTPEDVGMIGGVLAQP